MPDTNSAVAFDTRHGAGGPVALTAIARPATADRPADYLLLIQERSGRVLNAVWRLAVIPKAFHQPTVEASAEALLSTALLREFEEELLGRDDLAQLSPDSCRKFDPLHHQNQADPLNWLLEQGSGALRTECTSFGINLITGTCEFACLVVVEDERWWDRWGHKVEANWEVLRVHCYSSLDTEGLTKLMCDPGWSNEGLFSFTEGLRRLGELDETGRVASPSIELEVP